MSHIRAGTGEIKHFVSKTVRVPARLSIAAKSSVRAPEKLSIATPQQGGRRPGHLGSVISLMRAMTSARLGRGSGIWVPSDIESESSLNERM